MPGEARIFLSLAASILREIDRAKNGPGARTSYMSRQPETDAILGRRAAAPSKPR